MRMLSATVITTRALRRQDERRQHVDHRVFEHTHERHGHGDGGAMKGFRAQHPGKLVRTRIHGNMQRLCNV